MNVAKLKQLRKAKALSQEDMANTLHMSASNYSLIENGKVGLNVALLPTLCEALQCSPEDLFDTHMQYNLHQKLERSYFAHFQQLQSENRVLLQLMQKQLDVLQQAVQELAQQKKE